MSQVKENRNCPYCLSPVEEQDERVRCPRCGVVHHADCWKTNGSCSVYGCDGWAQWNAEITERIAPSSKQQVEVSAVASQPREAEQPPRCINCGRPVKPGHLLCFRCRKPSLAYKFDNCSGPTVVLLCGIAGIVALIVKALT
jgi:predicted RNA-binding Zn-ribbon protein involved in translation (DUF1610 family)